MNLALQKRHEQLERWRQNEANFELNEKKQQAAAAAAAQSDRQQPNLNNSNNKSVRQHNRTSPLYLTRTASGSKSLEDDEEEDGCDENKHDTDDSLSCGKKSPTSKTATATVNIDEQNSYIDKPNANNNKTKRTNKKGRPRIDLQVKFTNSTLFLTACANGDLEECQRLLDDEKLVDINVTTCDGLTGLHEAAICGNTQMVEYLLNHGAEINCCDNEGWTPLHAAASLGQAEIVDLLLEYGADVQIVNCENFLAYDLARNDQVRELIGERLKGVDLSYLHSQEERLIEKDIERWIQTNKYEERSHPLTNATVLHVIAAKGYIKLMKRILETPKLKKQINLEAKDNEGFTPLLAASFWNQSEIVELLIEHGANIFAQANNGYKISSIHLKNYQQSKLQQQNPTTIQGGRSRSSVDTDNNSNSSYTKTRSTTSLDSSATDTSFDGQQFGDNSARHTRPQPQPLLKSQSFEVNRQRDVGEPDATPLLSSSMSVDRLLSRAESMGEKDLRKSFKELVMENEKLRRQLMGIDEREKQKHQDWLRKERQLQRKISELEEENRQIEQWKLEIQRLKDENSSLIRVVSKLSKQ